MQSKAATVAEYLASLPPDRRAALEAVRKVFKDNLDPDIREGMQYGMIGYAIPHSVFPPGYHCDPKQPLPYAGLASQSGHMSLYLMALYGSPPQREIFEKAWKAAGKRLDMGKACIRFKKVEDLALDVLADAIRRVSAKAYIEHYQQALAQTAAGRAAAKRAAGTSPKSASKSKAPPKAKPSARAKASPSKVIKGRSSARSR